MISNAVRCVPPQNKPLPAEIKACNRFLRARIATLPELRAIVALGRVAHDGVLSALDARKSSFPFSHGGEHALGGLRLFDSYHCSRYNTNTGVLTPEMFRKVFARVRDYLEPL
jgi:uracil-DNA glycosylase family 4